MTGYQSLTKLLASSGVIVGTYPAGVHPEGIAFDGVHILLATNNDMDGILSEILASTGAAVATLPVIFNPEGVIFDGFNIWVSDNAGITKFGPTSLRSPSISPGGTVPLYSAESTIQPGEWASIYGTNLAASPVIWQGEFPTSLAGTSVRINGKAAYLWFVSPSQINFQAPDDIASGPVSVVVTTAGGTSSSTVTLAHFAPSFLLLDNKHVTGIILRSNGSGAYGGGTYDIIGPTGNSLGYATSAARAGDAVELFAVGLGPTSRVVLAGQAFSGSAPTTNSVSLLVNNVNVFSTFAGLSSAGLYQINLVLPSGLGTGDVSLVATVGGVRTPLGVTISLQ